ncbi:choice-of-anchor R domain-containing protein [Haloferula sp.]|uniref:choice-of-anchor R domain-containing protein n=1 Tax=Haloferula sp. TaxID=2497595 RepID=UPI003C782D5D
MRFAKLAPLVAILSTTLPSSAIVVVSNLSNASDLEAWTIGSQDADLTDSPVANRFTTGSGPGWNLDSVTLNLGRFEGASGSAAGAIDVYLAADNGGVPGASLVTFDPVTPTNPQEPLTLSPLVPTILAEGTSYWLVTSADVDDEYQWNFTEDVSQTGLSGWQIGDTARAGFPSGTWTPLVLPPGASPAPTLFEISATAAPEPGSLLLLTAGAPLFFRRRRR